MRHRLDLFCPFRAWPRGELKSQGGASRLKSLCFALGWFILTLRGCEFIIRLLFSGSTMAFQGRRSWYRRPWKAIVRKIHSLFGPIDSGAQPLPRSGEVSAQRRVRVDCTGFDLEENRYFCNSRPLIRPSATLCPRRGEEHRTRAFPKLLCSGGGTVRRPPTTNGLQR